MMGLYKKNKRRTANTDNMGKLFPAFLTKSGTGSHTFCFCSCTQDKFVMAVAPGRQKVRHTLLAPWQLSC